MSNWKQKITLQPVQKSREAKQSREITGPYATCLTPDGGVSVVIFYMLGTLSEDQIQWKIKGQLLPDEWCHEAIKSCVNTRLSFLVFFSDFTVNGEDILPPDPVAAIVNGKEYPYKLPFFSFCQY